MTASTISPQARDGFDHLLMQAFKGAFRAAPDAPVAIEPVADLAGVDADRAVILTVSSYRFRLLTLVYFTLDDATRHHFGAINRAHPGDMDDQAVLDVIAECGNICCGTLNRELARHFPHIGMSTPNLIHRQSGRFLPSLSAAHLRHFRARLGDALTLHVSLCVSDCVDIDFRVDPQVAEEATGELELF